MLCVPLEPTHSESNMSHTNGFSDVAILAKLILKIGILVKNNFINSFRWKRFNVLFNHQRKSRSFTGRKTASPKRVTQSCCVDADVNFLRWLVVLIVLLDVLDALSDVPFRLLSRLRKKISETWIDGAQF